MTVAQCQSTTGDTGIAALQRIRCHRDQIGNVRFLHAKTQEIRQVIQSVRGTIEGAEQGICVLFKRHSSYISSFRSSVPPPVAGGVCSSDWNAWRAAYDDLRNATCNMGFTRFGSAAKPIYTEIDRQWSAYTSCFSRELNAPNRTYSQLVRTYGVTSRDKLRQAWKKVKSDYLDNQDKYLAFYKSHSVACNATLVQLKQTDSRLVDREKPSCRVVL